MKQIGRFAVLLWSAVLVLAQNDAKCGTKGPPPPGNLGIRNGTDARPNEFPWMIRLSYSNPADTYFTCGASILNNQWVLTAGHCVCEWGVGNITKPVEYFQIFGGKHHLANTDNTTVTRSVIKIIAHESYVSEHLINDIALVKLNETFDLGLKQLGSICVPEKQDIDLIANHNCIATGWGLTSSHIKNGTLPNVLQKLTSHVWPQKRCKSINGYISNTTNLCWGEAAEGVCGGDSGGPLVCHVDGKWSQYGVTSKVFKENGQECSDSVFTRTSEYSKWIWETIQAN